MKDAIGTQTARYTEIDGIRGFASLAVLLCHMIVTPFTFVVPAFNYPGFLLLNGAFAVQVFFVLSGDALSVNYFQHHCPKIVDQLLLKRYFRLTMPILISSLVMYALMVSGLDWHHEAARITNSKTLGDYLPKTVQFHDMLNYALSGVYINFSFHSEEAFLASLPTAYNPVFWSMAVEMAGSLLVFLYLYAFPRIERPLPITIFLCVAFLLLFTMYAGFFFGLLLGLLRRKNVFANHHRSKFWQYCSGTTILVFLIGSPFVMKNIGQAANVLIAAALVYLLYTNNLTLKLFRSSLARILGDLSFPLYAMHFPVLISLSSGLIVWCHQHGGLNDTNISFIILLSICVSFLAAALLRRIEKPYLRALNYLTSFCLGPEKTNRTDNTGHTSRTTITMDNSVARLTERRASSRRAGGARHHAH